jgi:hypothetical protein
VGPAGLERQHGLGDQTNLPTPNLDRKLLFPLALSSPIYSLRNLATLFTGFQWSTAQTFDELMAYDAPGGWAVAWRSPFFLFRGESDVITLTSLAEEYFEQGGADQGLALINDAGHFAAFTQPQRFLTELRTQVAHWRPRPIPRPCPRCDRTTVTLGGWRTGNRSPPNHPRGRQRCGRLPQPLNGYRQNFREAAQHACAAAPKTRQAKDLCAAHQTKGSGPALTCLSVCPELPGESTATVAPTTGQRPLTRTAVSPDLGAGPVLPPLSGWQGVCRPHMDPVSRLDHGA